MSNRYLHDVLDEVSEEADRARAKFGEQLGLNNLEWLAVLGEEFGEAAMAVVKHDVGPVAEDAGVTLADIRAEVVQVAAVAARWVRAIDERAPSRELMALWSALETAWGIIANAGGGDWSRESADWQAAARRWADEQLPELGRVLQSHGRAAVPGATPNQTTVHPDGRPTSEPLPIPSIEARHGRLTAASAPEPDDDDAEAERPAIIGATPEEVRRRIEEGRAAAAAASTERDTLDDLPF